MRWHYFISNLTQFRKQELRAQIIRFSTETSGIEAHSTNLPIGGVVGRHPNMLADVIDGNRLPVLSLQVRDRLREVGTTLKVKITKAIVRILNLQS